MQEQGESKHEKFLPDVWHGVGSSLLVMVVVSMIMFVVLDSLLGHLLHRKFLRSCVLSASLVMRRFTNCHIAVVRAVY